MKINEIFDSKIADIHWTSNGRTEIATFTVDELKYHIQIHKTTIPGNFPKDAKTAEVAFFSVDANGQTSFSTTANAGNLSSIIYGIVLHALVDKFNEYDAFYFSTERRHSDTPEQFEQKSRLYQLAANRLAKSVASAKVYNYEHATGRDFIVSSIMLEQTDSLFNELDVILEQVGTNSTGNTFKRTQ